MHVFNHPAIYSYLQKLRNIAGWLLILVQWGCSSLFYQPDRVLHYPPSKFKLEYQEIKFNSKDGTKLVGWFFPAQTKPVGTVVQFHGNAENISSHYLSLAWLIREGFNLFTFDYRGYGKSEGSPDQKGTYLDGLAALEEAWRLNRQTHSKLIVVGQSLGGVIAMRALKDFDRKEEIDLIVMDSTFISYKKVSKTRLQQHWLTWIFSPLGSLLVSDEYASVEAVQENKIPLLIIHDQSDPVVPFINAEEMNKNANAGPKEFWTLNQGRHIGAFGLDNEKFRKRFTDYLRQLK